MAGYLIHIIIGEEYIKKHIVENEEEFIKGTIYPDSVKIKEKLIIHLFIVEIQTYMNF